MAEFKVGDVVQVKGQDGPPMTVAALGLCPGTISCIYFDQHDRLQQSSLPPELLVRVTGEKAE